MVPRRARRLRIFPLPVDGILLALTLAMMALLKMFPQAGPAVADAGTQVAEEANMLTLERAPAPRSGGRCHSPAQAGATGRLSFHGARTRTRSLGSSRPSMRSIPSNRASSSVSRSGHQAPSAE